MTTPPPETSPPIVTPTPEETRAITNAYSEEEIRALADAIKKSGELGFEPNTLTKGIITAIDFAGSPPTVTINIGGDTTTPIANVRMLNDYSPVVGHTVLISKQGPDIIIFGHIAEVAGKAVANGANGWTLATLSAGSHNGDSQGSVYYRRVLEDGSWKMQWQGGWGVSGTFMINTGQALATEFRPSAKRVLTAARTLTGLPDCQMAFHTDGRVELLGGTATAGNTTNVSGDVGIGSEGGGGVADTSHNHADWEGFATYTTFMSHSHGGGGGHDHAFFGGGHTHPVTAPTWVSLNGLEYFL